MTRLNPEGKPIGGHHGLDVYRVSGGILKIAHCNGDKAEKLYEANLEGVRNEARMLSLLDDCGYTPRLLDQEEDRLLIEDLGEGEPVIDGEEFRRDAAILLWTLRKYGVRHGDLTHVNTIVKRDHLCAIDFQQSNLFGELQLDKRDMSDSYHLWRHIVGVPSEMYQPDVNRIVRRYLTFAPLIGAFQSKGQGAAGKTLLDLGCFVGDHCMMARADGMEVTGVDLGGMNTGFDSIVDAQHRWGKYGCRFVRDDILNVENFKYDAVLLFSTWAYIVRDYGREVATDLLQRITAQCGVLFFETQLAGDGPGPEFLKTDGDTERLLGALGHVEKLETIAVSGRPASRTVWRVSGC